MDGTRVKVLYSDFSSFCFKKKTNMKENVVHFHPPLCMFLLCIYINDYL